ncbi:MAG: hypothetical protein GXY97_05700 [Clostridiales bacterium]|nr:hypothetical protein [Clostridiales bacterium]
MAWQTPKTNWGQPGQTVPGVDDFNRIEGNIETLGRYDRAPGYGVASGVNTKTVNLDPAPSSYYEGMCFAFRNEVQNTGPVTINVNGLGARSIKKPNGNDLVSGNLKAGSVYTVRYNGTNFILQGSDSAGNATPDDVRAGKTFSNDIGPDQVGTLPERQGHNTALGSSISGNTLRLIAPRGIYDGEDDTVTITDNNWIPENIKKGVNIFGKTGSLFDLGEPRYDYSNKLDFSITFYNIQDIYGDTTTSRTKTCRKAGQYRFGGSVRGRTTWDNQTFRIQLYINGALVDQREYVIEYNNPPSSISLYYVAYLNYGDTIRVQGYCSHDYRYTFSAQSGFKKPDTSGFFT